MKNNFYLLILILCSSCYYNIRTTNIVPPYKSLDEAKRNGALLYEYSTDSVVIYDSVLIRVKEAFLQPQYLYTSHWCEEKKEGAGQWFYCSFYNEDEWSNYGIDSLEADSSTFLRSWEIQPSFIINRSRQILYLGQYTDTVKIYITELIQYRDSLLDHPDQPRIKDIYSKTLLDSLVLIKKKN